MEIHGSYPMYKRHENGGYIWKKIQTLSLAQAYEFSDKTQSMEEFNWGFLNKGYSKFNKYCALYKEDHEWFIIECK